MNSTAVRLLGAAAEFMELAVRPGAAKSLMDKRIAGLYNMPGPLLLQAVDIVLTHRRFLFPLTATRRSVVRGSSNQ
jgi:hypothetical protein